MDKRLLKRHKRQVARAKDRVRLSEPDVRTPEEIRAAREASRPSGGIHASDGVNQSAPSIRNPAGRAPDSTAKVGV